MRAYIESTKNAVGFVGNVGVVRKIDKGVLEAFEVPQRLHHHVQKAVVLAGIVHHAGSRGCSTRFPQFRHSVSHECAGGMRRKEWQVVVAEAP